MARVTKCQSCRQGTLPLTPSSLDLHEYIGGASVIPTTPHPITNEQAPLTLGHEFSGIVDEVGEDIHDIRPGARVTIQPIIYDDTCVACKQGFINCCDSYGFVGLSGWGGGLSEYVVVPRKAVFTIPDLMSLEVAGQLTLILLSDYADFIVQLL